METLRKNILESIHIGNVKIKNRIGLAPINTGLIDASGKNSDLFIKYFTEYIINHIGLIYIGGLAVEDSGKANRSSFVLNDKNICNDIKTIINLAHSYEARIVIQIEHAGRQTNPQEIGFPIYAPSSIPCPFIGIIPLELDKSGINRIITKFVESAKIAEYCGADLLEIHAAHGYLISSFISPHSNHRIDNYGGSLQNRFRFLFEIVEKIKHETTLPIGIRINCSDNIDGGIEFNDILWAMKELESQIAYVSLTGGIYTPYEDVIIPSIDRGNAIWSHYSSLLKHHLKIPILLSGNINSIKIAEQLLIEKKCDFILMCRALIAESKLLKKYIDQSNSIKYCNYCNECKYHSRGRDFLYCPLNDVLNIFERRI